MYASFYRTALVLGIVSAVGPFAIDMYLPALPAIARGLNTDVGMAQMSLMAFFITLGICQLVYGPLSDMVGRKPPLYAGMALFAVASVGCALAPNIHTLIAFRALQGVGACAGTIIPRAIVRDLHTGPDAARLMSLLMLVFSVSPILAPLAGSIVIQLADWRGIFWVVTICAVALIAMMAVGLNETRPASARAQSSPRSAMRGYGQLMRDPHFLGLSFIGGFGISSFFIYLANSSFVVIEHYGLSPTGYSVFFAINAVAFIGAAQFNGFLAGRYGMERVVRLAVYGNAATLLVLLAIMLAGIDRLAVMAVCLFVGYAFLGLVIPNTAVLAMDDHGPIAGTAAAFLGTIQMVTGAVMMAVVGLFVDGSALPMVAGIAACSVVVFALTQWTLRQSRQPVLAE